MHIAHWFRVLGLALLYCLGAGAQTRWEAGVAQRIITPDTPIWIAGYASRNRPSEGVRQDIYVKALALRDEPGKTVVLVTADLVEFSREVAGAIAARCEKRYGLSRDRLVLNASHTHSAPVTGIENMPLWYILDEPQKAVIRKYTEGFIDKAVDVVGTSLKNLTPATLFFEQGLAGFAVNRRRVERRSLPGPVDQDVPVLSVRGADGSLRAIVFGYACHPTSLADYKISGDWAGFAQAELEQAHPGAVAFFVQDCGADANPLPRFTVDLSEKYGQIMAAAVETVLKAGMKPLTGPLATAYQLVDVPFQQAPTKEELQAQKKAEESPLVRQQIQHLLDILGRDGKLPNHYLYPVQVWKFGSGLKFIALGGEVVVDYALRLKGQYGFEDTWVAGYSNDVFAYIPSVRVLKEGGYEGGDGNLGDGHPASFGAAIEEIIVGKVHDLLESAR
jgi:neutral ceramidase